MSTTILNQSEQAGDSVPIAIVGGVLCTITFLVLLIVALAIIVITKFHRRNHTKDFSPGTNDLAIHVSALSRSSAPTIQNPTYSLADSKFAIVNIFLIALTNI